MIHSLMGKIWRTMQTGKKYRKLYEIKREKVYVIPQRF